MRVRPGTLQWTWCVCERHGGILQVFPGVYRADVLAECCSSVDLGPIKRSSHATPFSSRPESAEHTHVRIRKDVLFHIVNCLE
jgi:hypothetical protein